MTTDTPTTARTPLEQKERELSLIMALDQIRDTATDPNAMLAALMNALADRFNSDLCILSVAARESGELEVKTISHRGSRLRHFGADEVRRLAEHAYSAKTVVRWEPEDIQRQLSISNLPSDLHVAAIPVMMGPLTRLGAVVLARLGAAFTQDDLSLMRVAETQLDSAVIQGYAYYELQQRNKELEVIYRIDRIRDKHLPFDEMLNTVLIQLRDVAEAEMGFIMLYDRAGKRLDLRAYTHEDLLRTSPYAETVTRVSNESLEKASLVCMNDLPGELGSIMCVPLILNENILGVFGVANRQHGKPFDDEDRRLLNAIASQMDTAIFESLEQRRLRNVLGRSVDPRIMQRLLEASDTQFLKGERMIVSVLYADIRGSTSLAERTAPDLLVEFINDYLGSMTEVILAQEGTLDKFVGDEVMALFGAPFPQEDHALRACRVGLAMQEAYQGVMDRWADKGVERSPIGVGIATGELITGEMGSALRTDYTVLGRAANLGARICSAAHGGHVWISQATYDLVADRVISQPVTGLEMKGVAGLVTAYHVTRVK
jgi:adenylate cyclase